MQKVLLILVSLMISACAQEPYHLKISSTMAKEHGQSVYYRSSMRSTQAGQIRNVLSKKFGEVGIKTATSAETADFIAIFDINTIYKSDSNAGVRNFYAGDNLRDVPLFADGLDGRTQDYSDNGEIKADRDKTCFSLKIGRKNTSNASHDSYFCAYAVEDIEEMLPKVLDVYAKYGSYEYADIGMQCLQDAAGKIDCEPLRDPKKAFVKSLWIDSAISED